VSGERIILCLNCGQQNRLKAKGRVHLARCGRCSEPLGAPPNGQKRARALGLISLLLIASAGVVGYLVHGDQIRAPSTGAGSTQATVEPSTYEPKDSLPEAPLVPLPEPKPPLSFAEVGCELTARPANGTVFLRPEEGVHELIIDNGTSADAIVELRDSRNRDIASFYVHSRSTAKLPYVPEGLFELYFATGHNYSKECNNFMTDFVPWKFPGQQIFKSKIEKNFIYTTVMEFTLHEVSQGNISRVRIRDSDWFNG
jgi:hypothetical protein